VTTGGGRLGSGTKRDEGVRRRPGYEVGARPGPGLCQGLGKAGPAAQVVVQGEHEGHLAGR
jgi:hypothetical protein